MIFDIYATFVVGELSNPFEVVSHSTLSDKNVFNCYLLLKQLFLKISISAIGVTCTMVYAKRKTEV